jgi:ATP-dependent Clp protease ATP-binding subunit ClpB
MRTLVSRLDQTLRSRELRDFEGTLRRKIVGQDKALQAIVELYQVVRAGLSAPGRPVGNLLFLGPTGAGKTRVVEAAAEVLFGTPGAMIKVDCAEFQHSPRNCEVDRLATGVSGTQRHAAADYPGVAQRVSH